MDTLYPLRFKEILRNYGFGNRWMLEVFQKEGLPDDHRIAETWEVCDRPAESSVVTNGPLAGCTLHELIDRYDERLLGRDVVAHCGTRFPLLIKFLDASNPLGEQVHQDDQLAARLELPDPGKTEAWYMLHVRPGATVHCGNVDGLTRQQVHDALLAGTIRECMKEYAVQPGDAFLLHAGTMHYSKGGALFYEIMQNSDVGIGLRRPPGGWTEDRLHLAMEAIHLEDRSENKIHPVSLREGANRRTWLFVAGTSSIETSFAPYFALERLDLIEPYSLDCDGERFYVLSQIEGASTVMGGAGEEHLRVGHSCLLPAPLGPVTIHPDGPCSLLRAYVPDLVKNVVEPLRRAGVQDEDIAGLGGQTRLNPLRQT